MNIHLFVDLFQARLDKKACLGNIIIFIKLWASITSNSSSHHPHHHNSMYIQLTSSLCSELNSNESLSLDAD